MFRQRHRGPIDATLGPGRNPGVDGHPGVETALVELYRHTGEVRYLRLAGHLIGQRGHGLLGDGPFGRAYWQDHTPVRAAREVAGHAVRQLYASRRVAGHHPPVAGR